MDPKARSDGLQAALRHDLTPGGAVALLVFFAFAMQCMSTIAVVRRETGGWKWPVLQFATWRAGIGRRVRREPARHGPLRRDSVAKNGYPLPLSEPEKNSSTPPPTGTLRGCCSACARTGASRASWTSAAARPSIAARRATGEKDGRGRRRLAEGGPGAARRRRERERECTTSRTRAGASGRRRSGVRGRVGPERPSREGPPVGTAASPRGCLWACVWAGRRREGEGAPRGGRAARRGVRRRDAARLRPKDQEARVLQAAGRPLTSESVRPRPRRAWSSSARGSFALIASLAAHIVWQYVPSSSRTLRDLGGADGAAKRTCGDLRN